MVTLHSPNEHQRPQRALESMLRSRDDAQSKKFRLAAAIAFSYDYGHTSTNRATSCFSSCSRPDAGYERHTDSQVRVYDVRGNLLGGSPLRPGDDVEVVAKRLLKDKHNGGSFYRPLPYKPTFH